MSTSETAAPQVSPPVRVVNLGGLAIQVNDAQPTFWAKVNAGTWEPETLATLAERLNAQTTFLDIGAWVGPTSLFAAARAHHVIAVEADPAALAQLRGNLALNPELAANITLVDRAVSPTAAPVRFGARRKPGDSMSSALFAASSDTTWSTDAVTPAELADNIPPGTGLLIKLDIEGGEYALLPAMAALIARADQGLLISFHPRNLRASLGQDEAAFARATQAAVSALDGLSAHWLTPHGHDAMPIPHADISTALSSDASSLTWLFLRV